MPETHWHSTPLIRASLALHFLVIAALIADRAHWPWVVALVVADHLLVVGVGLWPRSRWLGANWTQLPAAAAARGEIALTIDDGPDPLVTPQVLSVLDRYGCRATFFCIGQQAARHPDLCREIVRRGHAIENHSQRHSHGFSLLGPRALMRELELSQESLTRICGQRPLFFRAPAGVRNMFLQPVLVRLGLRLASWSARGFDTRIGDAERVKHRLLRGMRPGAILLLHDGHAARTAQGAPVILDALPAILEAAAAAGLRAVTLREALA
ncbi:MAG: polysaccharide deacetylase [Ramlibacter sp.]|jgi:peptidoglycan/xylan/chitin deacetylase (PgdA/CDA1 family)|nr:polysaccharide deacetylase [Ramlibacter sp.]